MADHKKVDIESVDKRMEPSEEDEMYNQKQPLIIADPHVIRPSNPTVGGLNMKYVSLILLVVQNASLALTMRAARTQTGDMFLSTSAVCMAEITKVIVCLIIILHSFGWNIRNWTGHIKEEIFDKPMDTIKVAVPAFIYTVQNNLLYVSISNLPAAVFQVSYQLKILTTAMFSITMLGRSLIRTQWLSLFILFCGIAIVQVQNIGSSGSTDGQSPFIGFVSVILACTFSGFAGVYFEKVLKGSKVSVWLRNVQLGIFGSIIAFIAAYLKDGADIQEKGFFFGYNKLVWCVVANQACGGLLVAMVIKYADNILKGFATSLSIVLSSILSVFLFDYSITLMFTFGASLVIGAVYLYSIPAKK
ncbi:unnamed protein product [Oikopleura dioica]|uniref:Uncharacterized protein n=1 Tax=Oikopleura dioica TaxID=34765 RepID=E4X471_OIKDI|nr:unnamed protein product [Oikopleura dioica]CBY40954.1 unnamed protein product [Oikopleura dioica]